MESQWFLEDFSSKSKHLVVGFGSVRMFSEIKNKGFDWVNLFKYKYNDLDFKKLFVADIRNSWWHTEYKGLTGIGPPVLKKFLNEEIKKANASKTLYVGVSMGGYGAILFGCLTNATKVMAISPQTNLTETRRKKQLIRKFENYDIDESLTDLKSVLENKKNNKTIYKIWHGSSNTGDSKAAERISHIKNVNIYPIKSSKHNVIQPILKNGVFRKELEDFLQN
jgi:hypothetical protein